MNAVEIVAGGGYMMLLLFMCGRYSIDPVITTTSNEPPFAAAENDDSLHNRLESAFHTVASEVEGLLEIRADREYVLILIPKPAPRTETLIAPDEGIFRQQPPPNTAAAAAIMTLSKEARSVPVPTSMVARAAASPPPLFPLVTTMGAN